MAVNDYAIIIGVSKYPKFGSNMDIETACNGARKFHEWAASSQGGDIPPQNTLTFYEEADCLDYLPLNMAIRAGLDRWGTSSSARNLLYFYYSGHGVSYELNDPSQPIRHTLLTADSHDDDPNTAFRRETIQRCLATHDFPKQILFIDSCRRLDRYLAGNDGTLCARQGVNVSQHCYLASSGDGYAYPMEGEKVGCFTKAVIEGLRGAAQDASGAVTARGLDGWIKDRVLDLSKGRGTDQVSDSRLDPRFPDLVLTTPNKKVQVTFRSSTAASISVLNVEEGIAEDYPVQSGVATATLLAAMHVVQALPNRAPIKIDLRKIETPTCVWELP